MARIFINDDEIPGFIEALKFVIPFLKYSDTPPEYVTRVRRLNRKLKSGIGEVGEDISPESAVSNLIHAVYPKKNIKVSKK